jgi:hypothetical protein
VNTQSPRDAYSPRRIAELREQAGDNVREQHVVSRVILKQFADRRRLLHAVSVTDRRARVVARGPKGVGKIADFVPQASRSAEELWSETERQIPQLLRMCDSDAILDEPDAASVLRDVVALHYVRNRSLWRTHQRAYGDGRLRIRQGVRLAPGYEEDFRRRFGRMPGSDEDHEFFFEMVLARTWDVDFNSGLLFRASVERMFERCREWMSSRPIQLAHPSSGELLIGDVPVISLDARGRLGPDEGVALGDAVQIFMPLTPRSLVAFGPAAVGDVSANVVDELNSFQVRAAHEFVFVRPSSGLEQFVRDVRFGSAGATA